MDAKQETKASNKEEASKALMHMLEGAVRMADFLSESVEGCDYPEVAEHAKAYAELIYAIDSVASSIRFE